jgi:hypothetical protein
MPTKVPLPREISRGVDVMKRMRMGSADCRSEQVGYYSVQVM